MDVIIVQGQAQDPEKFLIQLVHYDLREGVTSYHFLTNDPEYASTHPQMFDKRVKRILINNMPGGATTAYDANGKEIDFEAGVQFQQQAVSKPA